MLFLRGKIIFIISIITFLPSSIVIDGYFNVNFLNPSKPNFQHNSILVNNFKNPIDNHSASIIENRNITSYVQGFLGSTHLQNNQIDFFWNFVPSTNIEEFSNLDGQPGWVKSIYDEFYIYFAFKYFKDATYIAIEFNALEGNNNSMATGNDGWILRKNNSNFIGGDIYYNGFEQPPGTDLRNDVEYESILDATSDFNYFEVRRPLDTKDESGFDIKF